MYIHLTTHSAFSLQEGLSTPADLVQAAQANGMLALGLTDHNLLTGAIEFVKACKAADIQPIVGLEINLNDGPVSLFATSLWDHMGGYAATEAPDLCRSASGKETFPQRSAKPVDELLFALVYVAIMLSHFLNALQKRSIM